MQPFNSKEYSPESLKADFRFFLLMVWKFKKLPDPTPTQLDIANYLQYGDKRVIIEAFRGVGKSWITSAFVVWQLYRNPEVKILVVSATKKRSDNFTLFTKSLISEIECLNFLKPTNNQRDSVVSFDVGPASPDHSPSVMAASITGQLAGSRADLIVADDVEIPNNSDTQAAREKLAEQVKEFDAVLKPGGRIVYLGTPQCEDSLYNELEKRGYVARVWPARYPSLKKVEEMGSRLAPMFSKAIINDNLLTVGGHNGKGQPTEPTRFHELDLVESGLSIV